MACGGNQNRETGSGIRATRHIIVLQAILASEEEFRVVLEIEKQTDRGAALIATALIELRRYHQISIAPSWTPLREKDLFGVFKPMSESSAKIQIGAMLESARIHWMGGF